MLQPPSQWVFINLVYEDIGGSESEVWDNRNKKSYLFFQSSSYGLVYFKLGNLGARESPVG